MQNEDDATCEKYLNKYLWTYLKHICDKILNGFQKEEEYACEAIWGMTGGGQLHPEVGRQIIKLSNYQNYQIIKLSNDNYDEDV